MEKQDCLSCMHMRQVRPDPNVLQSHAICVQSPPIPVALPRGNAITITSMFPPVGAGMICSNFQPQPIDEKNTQNTVGVLV